VLVASVCFLKHRVTAINGFSNNCSAVDNIPPCPDADNYLSFIICVIPDDTPNELSYYLYDGLSTSAATIVQWDGSRNVFYINPNWFSTNSPSQGSPFVSGNGGYMCLPKGRSFNFVVQDSGKDGMVGGQINALLDGEYIITRDGRSYADSFSQSFSTSRQCGPSTSFIPYIPVTVKFAPSQTHMCTPYIVADCSASSVLFEICVTAFSGDLPTVSISTGSYYSSGYNGQQYGFSYCVSNTASGITLNLSAPHASQARTTAYLNGHYVNWTSLVSTVSLSTITYDLSTEFKFKWPYSAVQYYNFYPFHRPLSVSQAAPVNQTIYVCNQKNFFSEIFYPMTATAISNGAFSVTVGQSNISTILPVPRYGDFKLRVYTAGGLILVEECPTYAIVNTSVINVDFTAVVKYQNTYGFEEIASLSTWSSLAKYFQNNGSFCPRDSSLTIEAYTLKSSDVLPGLKLVVNSTAFVIVDAATQQSQQAKVTISGGVASLTTLNGCGCLSVRASFDKFPEETSWSLQDSSGITVWSVQNVTNSSNTRYICTGSYNFTMYDSFGDGMCCSFGSGSWKLVWLKMDSGTETTIFESDGHFGKYQRVAVSFETDGSLLSKKTQSETDPYDGGLAISTSSYKFSYFPGLCLSLLVLWAIAVVVKRIAIRKMDKQLMVRYYNAYKSRIAASRPKVVSMADDDDANGQPI
jgi:hypothetical protein